MNTLCFFRKRVLIKKLAENQGRDVEHYEEHNGDILSLQLHNTSISQVLDIIEDLFDDDDDDDDDDD